MAVPALGKMHVEPLHPLVAGYEIDVAPVQRVPNVKITAGIWWWCVDTVRLARFVVGVEVIDVVLSPIVSPIGLFGTGLVVFV